MKFIDLFSGLGSFNLALEKLGHECVFACEIDEPLAQLYSKNFYIDVSSDIRNINIRNIPKHDILCAGFPCQPFSKAGLQKGLKDSDRGTLIDTIVNILKYHKPKYFILENVPNLKFHNQGKTWKYIIETIQNKLKYYIDDKILSPHQFGIPQIRDRIFIVGCKTGLDHFSWPVCKAGTDSIIHDILEKKPKNSRKLPVRELECLKVWQEFLDRIPKSQKIPSFPIWSMEFGATYPFDCQTPYFYSSKKLGAYNGKFGFSLNGLTKRQQMAMLPKYAQSTEPCFPRWKQNFIRQNREFYEKIKKEIMSLLPKIKKFPPSWQKLEWNCQGCDRKLFKFIIQFRASGIRIKRANYSPSLVASTSTQIPIIAWEKRYMKVSEAAKLQSLENLNMPDSVTIAFKALGNSVNAKIVNLIAKNLIEESWEEVFNEYLSKNRFVKEAQL